MESFTEPEAEALFHAYLDKDFGADEVTQHREALLGFARRVEMVAHRGRRGRESAAGKDGQPLGSKARWTCGWKNLRTASRMCPHSSARPSTSQPEREQKLLAACAVCVQEGFWLPLAAEIAELSEDEAKKAADRLVHSSLLRVIDRERRRFQLHALLREQVRARQDGDGLGKLQERHAAALEKLFKDWETRWQECRECLEEIIPAVRFLWKRGESDREWQLGLLGLCIGQQDRRAGRGASHHAAGRSALPERDDGDKDGLQAQLRQPGADPGGVGAAGGGAGAAQEEEAICLELGNKDGLQRSYGNQALILKEWGRLEEALALHKKEEASAWSWATRTGCKPATATRR